MPNKRGNLYGILLLILMAVIVTGLFTTNSLTTGFAVKSTKCFEGTAFGECSAVKPKYCDNGALKPDCRRCGCNENEACQSDGACLQKCLDGTLFGYCSENKPLLCSKGSLLENCFKCGCLPGQTCMQNGACAGSPETGAGAEEPHPIEGQNALEGEKTISKYIPTGKCPDGTSEGECSAEKPKYCDNGNLVDDCSKCGCAQRGLCSNGKCLTGSEKIGFLWGLFCRVFYFNDYDNCVADAIRYQNR